MHNCNNYLRICFSEGNNTQVIAKQTDLLFTFYRPGNRIRNNFLVNGETKNIVQLSGIIMHKDCITPYINVKIEL